jgi:hypothetical protein
VLPYRTKLSEAAIREFQRLYEAEFGEPLTYDEAAMRAREMVELYERLYLRDPKDFPKPEDQAARE